jgi:hypothetical protein
VLATSDSARTWSLLDKELSIDRSIGWKVGAELISQSCGSVRLFKRLM